jgi:uncharacterized protein (TIGR03435 family)
MNTIMRAALLAATTGMVCLYGQSFTLADVHTVAATAPPRTLEVPQSGRFEMHGATMIDLIHTAWDISADHVIGGPNWLEADRFDVIAQAPAGSTREAMNLMLRALLADRFSLVVHDDKRDLSAFTMTVAKGGVKMKKSDGSGDTGCAPPPNDGQVAEPITYILYVCHNMTMTDLAAFLPHSAPGYFRGTPLTDQTHLDGAWDFIIRWTGRGQVAAAGADGISLFDGTEKQLGLHVELGKAPLPVVVVDSVNEKPTDNAPGVTAKLPETPKEFEVAVIKPSAPATQGKLSWRNGRVDIQGLTLKDLVTFVWDMSDDRIAGLPGFAENDRYDITAKAPAGAGDDLDLMRTMLQALLKDRFKITSHEEKRPIEVLLLVASKPKLKKADPANRSQCKNVPSTSLILTRSVECQNTTMAQFAAWLGDNVGGYVRGRAVLDSTALDGAWDFSLSFSNAAVAAGRGTTPGADAGLADPNGALTLFDALEKQLGLKLDTQKRPMPVMVIDHIEQRPTEN